MSSPLHSLIYTSRAVRPFSTEDLDQLLLRSRANNRRNGITGMLVYLGGAFMQVLEGPEEAVAKLFSDKVSKDKRHTLVEVITKGPIPERKFGDWMMAFKNLDEDVEDRPEGFSDFVKQGFTSEVESTHKGISAAILQSFRRKFGPMDKSWGG